MDRTTKDLIRQISVFFGVLAISISILFLIFWWVLASLKDYNSSGKTREQQYNEREY